MKDNRLYKIQYQSLPEGVTIINKDELAALRAELARVEKQRDELQATVKDLEQQLGQATETGITYYRQSNELLAALQEARSLILGYRAGGDKEVTKRVIEPIDTAIANATKKGN